MKFEKKIIGKYILVIGLFFSTFYLLEKVLSGFWLTLFLLFGINVILAISLNIINGWIGFFFYRPWWNYVSRSIRGCVSYSPDFF